MHTGMHVNMRVTRSVCWIKVTLFPSLSRGFGIMRLCLFGRCELLI